MSRLLPKSLFGQTLLILLAGLILSHVVGSWIYTMDRERRCGPSADLRQRNASPI